MGNLQLFPDNQIIQNILMEDINIPYSELKEKVDAQIRPIYFAIDELIRNRFPSFPKLKISNSSKKPKRTRLRNSRAYWIYNNPLLIFKKEFYLFIQLGDRRTSRNKTIFWGVEYWIGGVSDEIDYVCRLFEKFSKIKVFKESGGVGGASNSGTSVFGVVNQYTNDEMPDLQRDIKEEIAEGIGKLFQEFEQIADSTTSDHSSLLILYLPTKEDVEYADNQLRNSPDEIIRTSTILDQIEINFSKTGKSFKENWREITEQNIKTWFSKK